MMVAFVSHVLGILLTIFAGGFWGLLVSTLLIGIANGTVEAACNPLIATMYPENKITKLNHFHLWFPGGIVIGGLVGHFVMKEFGLSWQIAMATMLLPAAAYGFLFFGKQFPKTERVSSGVSTREMYQSMLSPLFLILVCCMFGTAITELGTGQWIDVLLKNVAAGGLLVLVFINGIMAFGRGMAGVFIHKTPPALVLLFSSAFAALGLYLLSTLSGNMIFVAAAIFAMGVTYFWPTMLGFVSEYVPKTGAVGLAVVGAAGMLATFFFQPFIGRLYDNALVSHLPEGADLKAYQAATEGEMAEALATAKLAAGPDILQSMVIIPIILVVAFAGLYFFTKNKKQHA
jgi:MFS family permease